MLVSQSFPSYPKVQLHLKSLQIAMDLACNALMRLLLSANVHPPACSCSAPQLQIADHKAEPYCGVCLCFVLWCLFVRVELSGIAFGNMDLRLMLSGCLDRATVRVGRVVKGTISY